jgi:hypothetical protein
MEYVIVICQHFSVLNRSALFRLQRIPKTFCILFSVVFFHFIVDKWLDNAADSSDAGAQPWQQTHDIAGHLNRGSLIHFWSTEHGLSVNFWCSTFYKHNLCITINKLWDQRLSLIYHQSFREFGLLFIITNHKVSPGDQKGYNDSPRVNYFFFILDLGLCKVKLKSG